MMNILEEAIIYATILHQGKRRKFKETPFILHPLEVAQILSTMTDDPEIITAGILHDIVEGTDGTLEEIDKRFGARVAKLVAGISEEEYPDEPLNETWMRRKEESLMALKQSKDIGMKMLSLADNLANVRSIAGIYSELGDAMWNKLNQENPSIQCWYYKSIGETVELSLNKTGAFKEFIKHINFIWPGTFSSEKTRYKKYKEVSVGGCEMIGKGAKGNVYRYDDELIIKVFNQNNTYHDVEREIALSRRAFILGIPTAISFGIVSVGNCYGAMYELVDAQTISKHISRAPMQVDRYARIMAELAKNIHSIRISQEDVFPLASQRLLTYIHNGLDKVDKALAGRCKELIEALPPSNTLLHGDFHTGNVFLQNGEPLLIDMDRISRGHPIMEISDLYYFYVSLGEDDPAVVEKFMGFSYETAKRFFDLFLRTYLDSEDETKLREVVEKASLLSNVRTISRLHKKMVISEADQAVIRRCVKRIEELTEKLQTLEF